MLNRIISGTRAIARLFKRNKRIYVSSDVLKKIKQIDEETSKCDLYVGKDERGREVLIFLRNDNNK